MISELAMYHPALAATLVARKRVARTVAGTERFAEQIAILSSRIGRSEKEVMSQASRNLMEIVTVQSPAFATMFDYGLGPMHTRAWTVDADTEGLARLKELNREHALVFLPTHRSYADPFILSRLMRDTGMKRNHILGGNNLGFWPMGAIVRRCGGILIRRSFQDDEIYKLVVREYLGYIARAKANLEWYMEGGRSRTGKVRSPRYGLLSYLISAIESGGVDDMLLVPVSNTYDQLHEVNLMAAEEAGAIKAKEGLAWLAGYARMQQKWIGKCYVRFGEPLSLRDALARADSEGPGKWTVAKIAFEVFQRINRVTPVTAQALVTMALLAVRDRALTLGDVHELVHLLLDYARIRELPTSQLEHLHEQAGVEMTLQTLVESGVVNLYGAGLRPVYKIEAGQHSVAAFYRNSAIHWFVNRAILEVVMVETSEHDDPDTTERGWESIFALRDLLKFEFFFSDKPAFREEMKSEASVLCDAFRERIGSQQGRRRMLSEAPFLVAHRVLTPFLEAYFIVADRLAEQPTDRKVDKKALIDECVAVGRQYVLEQRLHNPECVSREVFGNALALAANRGLLMPVGGDLAERRRAFKDELWDAVRRVAAVDELDQSRHAIIGKVHA
ncbi:1-acyl-sn-glycerol-3-phosphate acyltransferase [Solimonas terrae]|uniref:Glycerol-3-phosphate acyltransferase n=1 Tax=Solimonas terrae TaxID=1396819 RepID=A0A6M2BY21_9GAMM|nr:1-acyl-sn-glycerol-3-phosphate acyltransferase [Solimonas terrae]NGY06779.1 glycerol-3-phosphate acyltransferase [Solimonas terrae]